MQSHRRQLKGIGLAPFQVQPGTGPRELEAPVEVEESVLLLHADIADALACGGYARTARTPTRVASRRFLTPIIVPITNAGAQLAVDHIRFATDQQELSDSLFTAMRACFGVGAMFSVVGTVPRGRFGFSDGRVRPEIEDLSFSLSLPSCLRIARSRRATYLGLPPPRWTGRAPAALGRTSLPASERRAGVADYRRGQGHVSTLRPKRM